MLLAEDDSLLHAPARHREAEQRQGGRYADLLLVLLRGGGMRELQAWRRSWR